MTKIPARNNLRKKGFPVVLTFRSIAADPRGKAQRQEWLDLWEIVYKAVHTTQKRKQRNPDWITEQS